MTNETQRKEELAKEIARYLKEEDKYKLYLFIFNKHDIATITKAYEEVQKVPQSRIKKSKSALFFYLLNKDAQKEK